MNSINSVNLIGRLTADPARHPEHGHHAVASLRLAVQRRRKDGEDQGADYVDVTVFGRQAETAAVPRQGPQDRRHRPAAPLRVGRRERPPARSSRSSPTTSSSSTAPSATRPKSRKRQWPPASARRTTPRSEQPDPRDTPKPEGCPAARSAPATRDPP